MVGEKDAFKDGGRDRGIRGTIYYVLCEIIENANLAPKKAFFKKAVHLWPTGTVKWPATIY
jgi:hypothetical protein